jgi:Sulfate permease family
MNAKRITLAAVVILKSMAYTSIAGLPLQVRLYTAFLPMILYAFLGTSRVLSLKKRLTASPKGFGFVPDVRQDTAVVHRPDHFILAASDPSRTGTGIFYLNWSLMLPI